MAFGPDHPDYEDWDRERRFIKSKEYGPEREGTAFLPTPDDIEEACAPLRPQKELELQGTRGVGTPMRHMEKKRLFVTSGNKRFYL